MVEAAIVLPILVVVVMGIIELGFAFASASTANGSSRSGARLAAAAYATSGTITENQQTAADQIAATVAADLKNLTSAEPIGMTIYRADALSTEGAPVGGFPADGMAGGCSSDCYRYEWDGDSMEHVGGTWPNPDACGMELDSIGVFVQVRHDYLTGFVGESVYLEGHTIMRLEPLPSDECGGSASG
jgi:hypothetical protein